MKYNKHVIITAGGIGNRMKSEIPKQFIEIDCKKHNIFKTEKITESLENW